MASQLSAKVVPINKASELNSSEKKWGKKVCALGFSVVPSLIFKAQARLGLNATQLVILLQIADHWWTKDDLPYPSKTTIGERLGLSPRQVQRYLTELEQGGFLKRVERRSKHKGQLSNFYDLTGLVAKLQVLEPQFTEHVTKSKDLTKKAGGLKAVAKK